MKIGFNMLLWTTHVTEDHVPILKALKATGYDGVEIPVFEGEPEHFRKIAGILEDLGLERTAVAIIPGDAGDPLSPDASRRKGAADHMRWVLDCVEAVGATTVCGPMHQPLGEFTGEGPQPEERERGIAFHREIGDYAARAGITLALEAINRFECYFLTSMAELIDYTGAVDHPAIRGMYDTFHANIEEKDPVAAIRTIAPRMVHVHISENDRGTPGRGHIDFAPVYRTLREIGYDGWLTIEAFGRALPDLAAATRMWRDMFPAPEQVYEEGFRSIRDGWNAAG